MASSTTNPVTMPLEDVRRHWFSRQGLVRLREKKLTKKRLVEHLDNYWTAPRLKAPERKRVIARNLKKKRVVRVRVEGRKEPWLALPEHLETLRRSSEPGGTTLVCPFDSLLWQRDRAEDLLGFRYRIEIYVPRPKRRFGYYVMPILHEGRLVGRLDPSSPLINPIYCDRQRLIFRPSRRGFLVQSEKSFLRGG